MSFLVLTDRNFVTSAINLDNVSAITLIDAGRTEPHKPLVNVLWNDGTVAGPFFVPTVDKGTEQTADKSVYDFFRELEYR